MTSVFPRVPGLFRLTAIFGLVAILMGLSACSPSLDWRDSRLGVAATAVGVPVGVSTLQALFPCRPERVERNASVLEQATPSQMHVCKAAGATWTVTRFQLPDPSRMSVSLLALRSSLANNVRGEESDVRAMVAPGMTPSEHARRVSVRGRQPDGADVLLDVAWVARGAEVVQVSVMGSLAAEFPATDARDQFFSSVHW